MEELEDSDEEESPPSSQCDIFAGHSSSAASSRTERELMLLTITNDAVEDNNEDIKEGSLRNMVLEADRIDDKDDDDDNDGSLWIQDIQMRSGSRITSSLQSSLSDLSSSISYLSMSSTKSNSLDDEIDCPGIITKFLANTNDSLRLRNAEVAGSRGKKLRGRQSRTPSQALTDLRLSPAYLFEGDFAMSEDETCSDDDTKFLANCNDSLLLHHAGEAGSRETNLRARHQSSESRNDLRRRRFEGLLHSKIRSEQRIGNMSDSTLISLDADALKARKRDLTTPPAGIAFSSS